MVTSKVFNGQNGSRVESQGDIIATGCHGLEKTARPELGALMGLEWSGAWRTSGIFQVSGVVTK